ncbi:MAG: T9SS type A sorting domain-containing protein [Bacteroidetes bacterium]|nr:T9SS type A sorting domain-containing protein [Bacteroidota bacterium]
MKTLRYILLCLGTLWIGTAGAQISLHIDPQALTAINGNTYRLNDTSPVGVTAIFAIYNTSNSNFADTLSFGYSITAGGSTATYNTRNYSGSGIAANGPPFVAIPAGDSLIYQAISFNFTSPVFVIGPTTVVIWPTLAHSGSSIGDSASAIVYIDNPAGVGTLVPAASAVYISGSKLVVRNPENEFGGIRIFDVSGKLIFSDQLQGDKLIPVSQYADGIYSVEITTTSGGRHNYKILKQ